MAVGWVILAIWVGFPLVYYLVQIDSRYHYPLDWSTFFLATVAAEELVEKKLRLRQPESVFEVQLGSDEGSSFQADFSSSQLITDSSRPDRAA
jgi:hypothetical protein